MWFVVRISEVYEQILVPLLVRRQPPCSARRAMLFVPALAQFEISGALNE